MKLTIILYSPDNWENWHDFYIPKDSYDSTDINDTIQQKLIKTVIMTEKNDTYYVTISANTNTLKSVLIIENNYLVDFRHSNFIARLLGFNDNLYSEDFQESENVVNIPIISSLLVDIGIVVGSYVNGSIQNKIYSFFPYV